MGKLEDIMKLRKLTGMPSETCEKIYDENDRDVEASMEELLELKKGKKKKPKEKKMFKVGDIIIRVDDSPGKLTPDCLDFLATYKKFKVLDVNDKLQIHIGHISPSGNPFYFSPNRFELIEGKAPLFNPEPTEEEKNKKEEEEKSKIEAAKDKFRAAEKAKAEIEAAKAKVREEKRRKIEEFEDFKRKQQAEEEARKMKEIPEEAEEESGEEGYESGEKGYDWRFDWGDTPFFGHD